MFSCFSNPTYIDQSGFESGLNQKDEAVLDEAKLYLSPVVYHSKLIEEYNNQGKTNVEKYF